jgi:hypothetical protein
MRSASTRRELQSFNKIGKIVMAKPQPAHHYTAVISQPVRDSSPGPYPTRGATELCTITTTLNYLKKTL